MSSDWSEIIQRYVQNICYRAVVRTVSILLYPKMLTIISAKRKNILCYVKFSHYGMLAYVTWGWKTGIRRSGMTRVLKGSQFHLHTSHRMKYTCLCLTSQSWYSFIDAGGMGGWVGLVRQVRTVWPVRGASAWVTMSVGFDSSGFRVSEAIGTAAGSLSPAIK